MSADARRILEAAARWIGTPYHHGASLAGAGTDCIGLVRGIWRDLYGTEPEALGAYSGDWAEASGCELLLDGLARHLHRLPDHRMEPGDVLAFRLRPGLPAKHCGLMLEPDRFLHVREGLTVGADALSPWWWRRIAGVFRFPLSRVRTIMATLALGAIGAAVGGAALPGLSLLGGALSGAAIGQAVGAIAGSFVDQALFGASGQARVLQGPRLRDLHVMGASEGAPIPRLYGRARVAGQMIWATRLEEQQVRSKSSGSGKGAGADTTSVEYRYYANFAVGLCEGPIGRIGRVWADGKELRLSRFRYRVYRGTEDQAPDSLIEAKEGDGAAPAYRGLAYVVFERMPLAKFGNRIPQLSFEVFRPVDALDGLLKAVTIIPGAGEFAYDPEEVTETVSEGVTRSENLHVWTGDSDWQASIDQLGDSLPGLVNASLVVSWFGSDLRAGECRIAPAVEIGAKTTTPYAWSVAGLSRSSARVVSSRDGRPAYGGTPSDAAVVRAIEDLKQRDLQVTFYPFVMMDIPDGNDLADPYGGVRQASYPWRGRITCHPAPGFAGSVDQTGAAATQIAAFVGTCGPDDFHLSGTSVVYTGPEEWSFRRMILHNAWLCRAAGGVDAFLIGSELKGLTTVRSAPASYPFVAALVALAADVRSVLGPTTRITYGADWSEYFGHQPQDGSGDVQFHLDPLWACADIDAVGIDCYWPLSDWRDGNEHLDRVASARSIYDLDYLRTNVSSGEGYDWYYASPAARIAQTRTAIADGAGETWVFRYKDIRNWWLNPHHDRPGGVSSATPTAWVPQSKPIWLTEVGCPAVDRGANQPNVFVDPKSAESALPHFSRGIRDDLMQRRYLEAIHAAFDPAHPSFETETNPVSSLYGGRMVDPQRLYAYTWDARPHPAFPGLGEAWGDAGNWQLGHWLTGRLGGCTLQGLVAAILDDFGYERYDVGGLSGILDGYVVDRTMSAREALQPLELAYFFDSIEGSDGIRFAHRGDGARLGLAADRDVVETDPDTATFELARAQESELPVAARITVIDADADYRQVSVESRRLATACARVATADLPIVTGKAAAKAIAETWLQDSWAARHRVKLSLPPSRLGLEVGDLIALEESGREALFRITGISDGLAKEIEALSIEPEVFAPMLTGAPELRVEPPPAIGSAIGLLLDLPLVPATESAVAWRFAAFAEPWPGGVALYRSASGSGFTLAEVAGTRATLGRTLTALPGGPSGRWDRGSVIRVALAADELQSSDEISVLGGSNVIAVECADGEWELLQFVTATLVAPATYELSMLLRGQSGTEGAVRPSVAAGARVVLLNEAVLEVALKPDDVGLPVVWRWGPAELDIGHAGFQSATRTLGGLARRPYSPVHVRGSRDSAGDLTIRWIRRTRIGGDSWTQTEVPLAEESERYEIDILDGETVVRTLSTASAEAVYTAAQQVADFGSAPTSCSVRISQVSPSYGRGAAVNAVL